MFEFVIGAAVGVVAAVALPVVYTAVSKAYEAVKEFVSK